MLAAEGHVHRRQRRVATPAFSIQNLRALVPLVFRKGYELRDKWSELLDNPPTGEGSIEIDVCHWISRATFDVIGLAGETFLRWCIQQINRSTGFDYHFNAIQNESDELFSAYKDMFEIAQGSAIRMLLGVYFPILDVLFVSTHGVVLERFLTCLLHSQMRGSRLLNVVMVSSTVSLESSSGRRKPELLKAKKAAPGIWRRIYLVSCVGDWQALY